MPRDPHRDQPIFVWGAPPGQASAALLMVHGRGGSVDDMRAMAGELAFPQLMYIAPAAAGRTWYPYSLREPLARNESHVSSGLRLLARSLEKATSANLAADRIVVLGFSQGACLTLEFAVRNARRYGGVIGLSGGLIGPEGTPREYSGRLDSTPVFLGCGDVDPHVPKRRVDETAAVLERLGARVTERIYPGMGHTVNADEITATRGILDAVLAGAAAAS